MKPRRLIAILSAAAGVTLVLVLGITVAAAHAIDAWDVKTGRECADWPKRLRNAEEALLKPDHRFFALSDAAKAAYELGDPDKARSYAKELLETAPKYEHNWNFGNAVHDGHMVLGRVALSSGDMALARAELLAAGATPGSPQLDSFGPNMSLARDLLRRGDRETVLQYFRECDRFWKLGRGRLRRWSFAANLHLPPSFGANLIY